MPQGFISVGTNIDREENLPSSIFALNKKFGVLTLSSIYESEAVGFSGSPFFNQVIVFHSNLPVKEVAKILKQIEIDHGRTKNSVKFSPRTLDLDLLLYGDLIVTDGRLSIPREEITQYAFVLEPLAEIAPMLNHPVKNQTMLEMWNKFEKLNTHQSKIACSEIS